MKTTNKKESINRISKLLSDMARSQDLAIKHITASKELQISLEQELQRLELLTDKPYKSKEPQKN